VTLRNGVVVKLDMNCTLGLAIVMPNGSLNSGKYEGKMHFGSGRSRLKGSNVVFKYSNRLRTDMRFKARCFQLQYVVCDPPLPTPTPTLTAGDIDNAVAVTSAEVADASPMSHEADAVPAMKVAFFDFMRKIKTYFLWVHFAPPSNDLNSPTASEPFDISQATQSILSKESTTDDAGVGSMFMEDDEHVIFESATRPSDLLMASETNGDPPTRINTDLVSYVWLSFIMLNWQVQRVKFFMAKAFYDYKTLNLIPGDHNNSNFVLENTFRYLHNKTLVVVLGILLPSATEASTTPIEGNKLVMVAKEQPTNGEWKAFYVGGLSLMPVECETTHGLQPSSELPPVAAAGEKAIHEAGADLLRRSDSLGEGDMMFLNSGSAPSSRSAFTNISNRGLPVQGHASNSATLQTPSPKKRKLELAANEGQQQRGAPSPTSVTAPLSPGAFSPV